MRSPPGIGRNHHALGLAGTWNPPGGAANVPRRQPQRARAPLVPIRSLLARRKSDKGGAAGTSGEDSKEAPSSSSQRGGSSNKKGHARSGGKGPRSGKSKSKDSSAGAVPPALNGSEADGESDGSSSSDDGYTEASCKEIYEAVDVVC